MKTVFSNTYSPITETKPIDQYLPPLNLDAKTTCNCFKNKRKGIVLSDPSFESYRDDSDLEVIYDPLQELLDIDYIDNEEIICDEITSDDGPDAPADDSITIRFIILC